MMTQPITINDLSDFTLFKSIADESLTDLIEHCQLVVLDAGETLFEQDDTAEHLYLVLEGHVALIRRYDDGDVVLANVGPQEVLGELSMIVKEPRTASGIALEKSRMIMLHRDQLFLYLQKYPSVAIELTIHLAQRLRDVTLMVREWSLDNAEARLASLVLFLAEEEGQIQTGLISTSLRMRNLARGAGVSLEWLAETIEAWSQEGYIGVDGRRFLLHDKDALIAIAGWE